MILDAARYVAVCISLANLTPKRDDGERIITGSPSSSSRFGVWAHMPKSLGAGPMSAGSAPPMSCAMSGVGWLMSGMGCPMSTGG